MIFYNVVNIVKTNKGKMNMKERKELYVIFSRSESTTPGGVMYWSNEDGWGDYVAATRFSRKEKRIFNLPISRDCDAEWVRIYQERK
jgi:hypothetical protein